MNGSCGERCANGVCLGSWVLFTHMMQQRSKVMSEPDEKKKTK